ncbi:MAG: type II secretion system protein [Halanaerobiaceae bacterium]
MQTMRKMLKRKEGFTLIELMIVIVILGVLAAIIVPRMTNLTESAKISAGESSLRSIYNGLEMYHVKYGEYPSSIDDGSEIGEFIENYNSLDEFLGEWEPVDSDYYTDTAVAIRHEDDNELNLTLNLNSGTVN